MRYFLIILFFGVVFSIYAIDSQPTQSRSILSILIEKSFAYNLNIKSQELLISSSLKDLESSEWQYFPKFNISMGGVSASNNDTEYSGDNRVIKAEVEQTIWDGGSISSKIEIAKANIELNQSEHLISKRDTAISIVNLYKSWYKKYLEKLTLLADKAEFIKVKNQLENRIQRGVSSNNDLNLITTKILQIEASLKAINFEIENSILALENSIGEKILEESLIQDISRENNISGNKDNLLKKAIDKDPRIKLLSAKLKKANADYTFAKSSLHPKAVLRVNRQWGDYSKKDVQPRNRVFLEFSSQLGPGLESLTNIDSALILISSQSAQLDNQKREITQSFNVNWGMYHKLMNQIKLLEEALALTQDIKDSSYRRFNAGKQGWQEFIASIQEASRIKTQIIGLNAELLSTVWRLKIYIYGVDNLARL